MPLAHCRHAFALTLLCVLFASRSVVGQSLPDLYPEITDVSIQKNQTVAIGDVVEGCAASTEGRTLIRFSHTAWNGGAGDLLVGDPACPDCETNPNATCANPLFICSGASGHGHPHMQEFSFYSVKNARGQVVATGHKEGFCLMNSTCMGASPDTSGYPACSILSAGCADVYGSGLGCQYVDITHLPAGDYMLDVTLNKNLVMAESDFFNNTVLIPFTVCSQRDTDNGVFNVRFPNELGANRRFSLTTVSAIGGLSGKFNPRTNPLTLEIFQNGSSYATIGTTVVAGLPGDGCDPRDGWRRIKPGKWKYRSFSGLSMSSSCYSQGVSLDTVVVESIGSTNSKYRITWQGSMAPNTLPGKTTTMSAKVSLNGGGLGGNETCDAKIEMPSCSIKNLKRQPVLTCKP